MEVIIGLATPSSVGYVAGMETPIRPWSVVIAASVSLTVGITFGIYPARQAARITPIAALRRGEDRRSLPKETLPNPSPTP